ncbi:MAG: hypothetical protein KA954_10105 [Chitinophagales bacterium]|nr:hypothetical protein [Chitinophagales bacterium]MBP8753294.1 hypothetical protein [Chitinophagales bacterium]MBP9188415.1 hypothetical protein [Chitinophagales bacterium]MBP9548745.1 hypothetical protein [Chitinophagales bacterium]MBP9704806.1 hypothetical protein [Chitinophagales bacterium]
MKDELLDFNDREKKLMFDSEIFPTKHRINEKIISLFNAIGIELKDKLSHQLFTEVEPFTFKITKGENYLHQPYLILDIPKINPSRDILVFRCMFWYGHFFSISLLATGNKAIAISKKLQHNSSLQSYWQFSIAHNPWNHDFYSEYFKPLHTLSAIEINTHINTYQYLKLSCKITSTTISEIQKEFIEWVREIEVLLSGSADTLA